MKFNGENKRIFLELMLKYIKITNCTIGNFLRVNRRRFASKTFGNELRINFTLLKIKLKYRLLGLKPF
jgi:hypothetical protein